MGVPPHSPAVPRVRLPPQLKPSLVRIVVLFKERLGIAGLRVSMRATKSTAYVFARTPHPAPLLLLDPPQIPVLSDPFKCELEQVLLSRARAPLEELLRRGTKLQVGDVRREDVQSVENVRRVWRQSGGRAVLCTHKRWSLFASPTRR